MDTRGTLAHNEVHPAAQIAVDYIAGIPVEKLYTYMESFSSCAIEGNRLAEVCAETLRRLMDRRPVSDRYVMGLAWAIWEMERNGRESH
jgi:hypothetical protein